MHDTSSYFFTMRDAPEIKWDVNVNHNYNYRADDVWHKMCTHTSWHSRTFNVLWPLHSRQHGWFFLSFCVSLLLYVTRRPLSSFPGSSYWIPSFTGTFLSSAEFVHALFSQPSSFLGSAMFPFLLLKIKSGLVLLRLGLVWMCKCYTIRYSL